MPMEPSVRVMGALVEAKLELNAPMVDAELEAVNPFKPLEDSEWSRHGEQLRMHCAQSGRQLPNPPPPVDYLCGTLANRGLRLAIALREAMEVEALKHEAAKAGSASLVPERRPLTPLGRTDLA